MKNGAADPYRVALQAICPNHDHAAALDIARRFAASSAVAAIDAAVLTGRPVIQSGRLASRWERQHVDILRAVTTGDLQRATGLLVEHLAEHGCDPTAIAAVASIITESGSSACASSAVVPASCAVELARQVDGNGDRRYPITSARDFEDQ